MSDTPKSHQQGMIDGIEGELTYYEEYCTRFPECNLPVEVLSLALCRKAVFEGYVECPHTDDEQACLNCWKEVYSGDVTEVQEEEDTGLTSI